MFTVNKRISIFFFTIKYISVLLEIIDQVTDTNGCVFPFDYNGQTFTECTNQDQDYSWCSYTSEFRGIWKYCNDQRESTWTCVDDCELFRSEHYESCWANQEHTIRKYCVDKILDMSKTSANILGNLIKFYSQ